MCINIKKNYQVKFQKSNPHYCLHQLTIVVKFVVQKESTRWKPNIRNECFPDLTERKICKQINTQKRLGWDK